MTVLLAALAASVALAAPARTFTDPVGDAPGAPDISTVAVATAATSVIFTIHTTRAADWNNAAAILEVDTDASPATGYELSYVLHSEHNAFTLDRGDAPAQTDARADLSGSILTIQVPTAELGGATRIGFRVSTPAPGGEDRSNEWFFEPSATVASVRATFAAGPVRGRTFAVRGATLVFTDGTTGATTATCAAKAGGRALRGGCRWLVPKAARSLTVVVRAGGVVTSRTFRVR